MTKQSKVVFTPTDTQLIESPDCKMRNRIMVTGDSCGAQQYSAGLFYVRPGARGHADKHPGMEELYYILAGKGKVMIDDTPHEIKAGDVVFIPDGCSHYLINEGDEDLGLFWAIARPWSNLQDIQREVAGWSDVDADSEWSPLP